MKFSTLIYWKSIFFTHKIYLNINRTQVNSVKASVIFGVFAPETNLYENLISNFKQSLFGVFNACENDPNCSERYPDIKSKFFNTLKKLETTPLKLEFNGDPFVLNAQDMLLMTHQLLYSRSSMGLIPSFIDAIDNKNPNIIRQALRPTATVSSLINFAMNMSVNAYDELPFNGDTEFSKDLKRNPEFHNIAPAYFNSDAKLLEKWHPFRADAYENKAVVSDIPTLVLNGRLDPVTPPQNARKAVKSLSNSYFAEFKMEGHSFFNACFFDICSAFLDNPDKQPDLSCINEETSINWN